ncbi:uncharacterized protein [Watersipora subatra]|uniref:uncharacterized protein n=1 Tax=Watersipora subatra TaxID=2589382 RepID=UPI00355B5575
MALQPRQRVSKNASIIAEKKTAVMKKKAKGNSQVNGGVGPSPVKNQSHKQHELVIYTESEDEAGGYAYGDSGSEEEELKNMVEHDESNQRNNTTEDEKINSSEDQETPRRIPQPVNEKSRISKGNPSNHQKTPRDRGTNGKAASRTVKGSLSLNKRNNNNGDDFDFEQTFGDDERKCVKEFKEAYDSYTQVLQCCKKQATGKSEMPLDEEVQHLTALADVYQLSAVGTLNIHNLLRTSGLYNACLKKCVNQRPDLYARILDSLTKFEETAMRRILKLKSTNCHLFAHQKKTASHIKELQEIRDICSADFKNIKDSFREFPSAQTLLKQKSPSKRHIAAEENVMATTSLMFGEVTERMRGFLAGLINECFELQGPSPCNYVLVGHHKLAGKDLSPFEPISLFIIIEKETAGIKAYFRNTLALLAMKIINLGETSLLSLNIRSIAWFTIGATPSGLAMANFIDDTEKKEFSTIPLECLKTPKELLKLAVSDKHLIRQGIITLLHNMTFITGDMKMYKELAPVRTAVLQREQTEKSYKKSLFTRYQNLVRYTDPLSMFALQEGNEDEIQSNVMSLVTEFVDCFCDMAKNFSSDGTINRLEEMMPTGSNVSYGNTTITTDTREKIGVVSTISTRLETPESTTPSPEPVKLPDIPVVIKKKDTWTFDRKTPVGSNSPLPDNNVALRKLKERKANLHTEYRKSVYFHIPRGAEGRGSRVQRGGATSDVSSSTGSSGFSNTWRKQRVKQQKPKPKTPPNLPTPEPIERFVYIVPAFDGKAKNVLSAESARYLILLHSLTSAITLSNRSATCLMSTKHKSAFTIGSKDYEDLNVDDDEFIVALTHFQNRKYVQCCKAIYRYLENRSDITFVGEPFAADFIEVCQELLEDQILTPERFGAIHLLLAHCQGRRNADDEALSLWSELLSKAETAKEKANIYANITECCLKLGRKSDALKSATRAINLYREAQITTKTINFQEDLEKMQKIKQELQ